MGHQLATIGESAWDDVNFLYFVNSVCTKGLDQNEVIDLRGRIAEQLKKIRNTKYINREPPKKQEIFEAWNEFCEYAYSDLKKVPKVGNIDLTDVVGLPKRETTAEEKTLQNKLHTTCGISAKVAIVMVVPGFFAGGVGAGYLTDYLTGSKSITYIATSIGAVAGAFIAFGFTYLASLPFVNHFENKLKKETKSKDHLFMQHIEEYIKYVENTPKS